MLGTCHVHIRLRSERRKYCHTLASLVVRYGVRETFPVLVCNSCSKQLDEGEACHSVQRQDKKLAESSELLIRSSPPQHCLPQGRHEGWQQQPRTSGPCVRKRRM